jgi:hypothetical protein
MPKQTEFSVKDYIADLVKDVTVPEDQRKALETVLAQDVVAARVRDSVLRQSEFSRQMDALTAERKHIEEELKKAETTYNGRYAGLAKWKSDSEAELQRLEAAAQAEKARADAATAALEKAAREYDFKPTEVGFDTKAAPATNGRTDIDPKQFLTRKEWEEETARLGQAIGNFSPELLDIQESHRQLFPDKPLSMKALVDAARKEGRTVQEVWSERFKVGERMQELQQQAVQKHDDAIREDERKKVLTEVATGPIPGSQGRPDFKPGPIWEHVPDLVVKKDANGAPENPVMAAVEALRIGKYARQQTGASR